MPGDGDGEFAGQVFGRKRLRMCQHFRQRAGGDQLPSAHPGAGAKVEDIVGVSDGVGIVFNHKHRVAQVAQSFQRPQQAIVIALVQADAGLVKNIEDSHETSANLGRQADALRLAAAQRATLAVERQIAQPDVPQKPQPSADFLDDVMGDLLLKVGQLEAR